MPHLLDTNNIIWSVIIICWICMIFKIRKVVRRSKSHMLSCCWARERYFNIFNSIRFDSIKMTTYIINDICDCYGGYYLMCNMKKVVNRWNGTCIWMNSARFSQWLAVVDGGMMNRKLDAMKRMIMILMKTYYLWWFHICNVHVVINVNVSVWLYGSVLHVKWYAVVYA